MARVCIISHSHYPYDSRVSRQARALVRAGHEVDVICLQFKDQPFFDRAQGVSVFRLPIGRLRGGKLRYLFEFAAFQLAATVLAGALHLRNRYAVVETTSVPDWLVFAGIVPKLFGARVLLDLHECMPEYGATKYGVPLEHRIVRVLTFLERASIRFADFVTTCTEQMRERFIERGAPAGKIAVVLNSFDDERFEPERYLRAAPRTDRFTLICHGTIEPNYRRDAFRDVTLCTKMFDLVALRKPLVISRTRAVDAYFGSECFQMFESGDERDLAEAIYAVYTDRELRDRLVRNATARNEPYRWVHQAQRYIEIVERLATRARAESPREVL